MGAGDLRVDGGDGLTPGTGPPRPWGGPPQQRKGPAEMYIDVDTIIKAASLLGALVALIGAIIAVYKVYDSNRKQTEVIKAMQEEQTLICYGLRGALQGLIEQGCDGPCKDALNLLDKHLNKEAHHPDL